MLQLKYCWMIEKNFSDNVAFFTTSLGMGQAAYSKPRAARIITHIHPVTLGIRAYRKAFINNRTFFKTSSNT